MVIVDADTIPDQIAQIHVAVDKVRPGGEFDFMRPFEHYWYVPQEHIGDFGNHHASKMKMLDGMVSVTIPDHPGGIIVTRQDAYWGIGGFDERFSPDGEYEDNAFMLAAHTLARVGLVSGTAWSLECGHKDRTAQDLSHPNRTRLALYEFCSGKPELMRELLK